MMRVFACLAAVLTILPQGGMAAMDDVACDDRARLVHKLSHVLGAERQGSGLRDPETVLEIWITPQNGDWILVQSYTNGTACIVAMGEHWDMAGSNPA